METIFYNISQVLGITIIHSLWQGLIIYLLLRILLLCLPSLSSVKKYNLSVLALLGITVWFACTFYTEARDYDWNPITTINPNTVIHFNLPDTYTTLLPNIPEHSAPLYDYKDILFNTFKSYLPYISVLYIIGLIINLSGLVLAWNRIRIIKQNLALAEKLQQQVIRFSQQLHIRKFIQVSFTRLVDVPCVIGYFKPILLLPVTLTTQLSAEEIEAILLHELAHIKSNDYLFNLLQQMISVLLFFNPFARLINQIISRERENRCDDVVVQTTGNPLIYAHALLKLEENRQTPIKLALAATGKKHHLLTRIERIMQAKKPMVNTRHLVLAIIIFTGSLISISWLNPEIKNGKIVSKNIDRVINKLSSVIKMQPAAPSNASQPNPEKVNKTPDAGIDTVTTPIIALVDTPNHKPADSVHTNYNSSLYVKPNGISDEEWAKRQEEYKQQWFDAELKRLEANIELVANNKQIVQEEIRKQLLQARLANEMKALEVVPINNQVIQPDKPYNYVLDGVKADEKTVSQLGPLVLGSALIEHAEEAAKLSYVFNNDGDVTFLFTKKGTDLGNEVKEKLRKMNGLTSIPSGAFIYEPSPKVRPLKDFSMVSRPLKTDFFSTPSVAFADRPPGTARPVKDISPVSRPLKNDLAHIPSNSIVFGQGDKMTSIKDYHEFKKDEPVIIASAKHVITRLNKTYYYGDVTLISEGIITIKADTIVYDRETEKANAYGHVTMITKTKDGDVSGSATEGIFSLANHTMFLKDIKLGESVDPKETAQANTGPSKNQSQDMQQYLTDTKKLVKDGKYKEALQRDIWFYDHALEYDKGMGGVRLSFALNDWKGLAAVYPPAMATLKSIRDRETKQLINNTGSPAIFADVTAINHTLNDDARTIDLFQLLAKAHPDAAQQYWHSIKGPLFAAKRYDLIHKYIGSSMQEFENVKKIYDRSMLFYNDKRDTNKELFKAMNDNMLVKYSIELIQYELAEKDISAAKKIQQQALLIVQDDRLRNAISN